MNRNYVTFRVVAFVTLASAGAATRTATSLSDVSKANDGVLTLREAIAASGTQMLCAFSSAG